MVKYYWTGGPNLHRMSGSVCGSFKVHLFGSPGEFPSCRVFLSISSASICAARPVFPAEEETFQGWLIIFDLTAAQTLLSPFHVLDMLCWIPCFFLGFLFWGSAHGVPQTNARPDVTDQELFWGSDQYDFAIVLPAAGLECFWHFAHRGERFYLNFMVRRKLCVKLSEATWHVVCFPTNVRLAWTPASVPSVEKSSRW